jgi:error-prone DNA polymerase
MVLAPEWGSGVFASMSAAWWRMMRRTSPTREGKRMVYPCTEDRAGIVDITIFPDGEQRSKEALFKTGWLGIEGALGDSRPG